MRGGIFTFGQPHERPLRDRLMVKVPTRSILPMIAFRDALCVASGWTCLWRSQFGRSPAPTTSPSTSSNSMRIRSLAASTSVFMNPRVSERVRVRSTSDMGILASRYATPRAFASDSLKPTRASSGSVNKQKGTCRPVVTRRPPARLSRTTRRSSKLI
jgi:hypothetical protein